MEYNSQVNNMDIQRISYYSNKSKYIQSDSDIYSSFYEDNYNNEDNYEDYNYYIRSEYSNNVNSLYSNSIINYEENVDDIIDFYFEENGEKYDNLVIKPFMQLPLSQNQYMLMKHKWDKQLELDIMKQSVKFTKVTRLWKSFFNKFSKKNKKNQISFYDNLVKHV
jgi:hypothetical protein